MRQNPSWREAGAAAAVGIPERCTHYRKTAKAAGAESGGNGRADGRKTTEAANAEDTKGREGGRLGRPRRPRGGRAIGHNIGEGSQPVTTALKEAPEQQLRVDGNRRSALRRIAADSGG